MRENRRESGAGGEWGGKGGGGEREDESKRQTAQLGIYVIVTVEHTDGILSLLFPLSLSLSLSLFFVHFDTSHCLSPSTTYLSISFSHTHARRRAPVLQNHSSTAQQPVKWNIIVLIRHSAEMRAGTALSWGNGSAVDYNKKEIATGKKVHFYLSGLYSNSFNRMKNQNTHRFRCSECSKDHSDHEVFI